MEESRLHVTLNQGVELDVVQTKQFKTNQILINFASRQTRANITSRSLLANLLETSTHKYPTQTALARQLSSLYGAYVGAGVGRVGNLHTIKLRASFINDQYAKEDLFSQVLAVMHEMIFNPLIDNQAFDLPTFNLQKANLKSAIESLREDKQYYALQQLKQSYFSEGSLQKVPSFGDVESLKAITAESVVQTYQDMIQHDQINIIVMGDFEGVDVPAQLASFDFAARLPISGRDLYYEQPLTDAVNEQNEQQLVNQSKLNLAYQLPIYYHDDRYFASLVMNGIFGATPLSKLFMNVREKASLAYYANSIHNSFNGLLTVQTGINASDYSQAKTLIEQQLTDVQNGDFEDHLQAEVIAGLVNQFQSGLDSGNNLVARALLDSLTHTTIDNDTFIKKLESVTKDDVMEVAQLAQLQAVYFLNGDN
jgi:predicted Zn-dependent peptidase